MIKESNLIIEQIYKCYKFFDNIQFLRIKIKLIIHMNDVPSISYIMPQDSVHFFNLCGDIMICTKAETLLIQSLLSLLTTSKLKSKEDPHFFCEVT